MSDSLSVPAFSSFSTVLKRLEAATSRLEDIALSQVAALPAGGGKGDVTATTAATTSKSVPSAPSEASVSSGPFGPTSYAIPAVEHPGVVAYREAIIKGPLQTYLDLSNQVDDLVTQQSKAVAQAFNAQLEFVDMASKCAKIPMNDKRIVPLLQGTQEGIAAAIAVTEANRPHKLYNLLATVSEGIPALAWVTISPKPFTYVGELRDSAQFYANRVLKEYKTSNPLAVDWARSYVTLLDELKKYVLAHHGAGLYWNPKGGDPPAPKAVTATAPASGAPPPPPPPAPGPPAPPPAPKAAAATGASMDQVFAELNKGEDITKGLKKVDKSEMTHKNPELRATSVVPAKTSSIPTKPPKPSSMQKKPPVKELVGNKWNIENFDGDSNIVIENTELSQIVNVFNVKASVIQIKGKINAISLVNCPKTSVLLESVVSTVSISSSNSFTVQILGKVPTITVDGTDGGQIYLSPDSLDVEIISAKSSALNISLPVPHEDDGVFEESPLPEQFKTVIKDGKPVTTIVEHSA